MTRIKHLKIITLSILTWVLLFSPLTVYARAGGGYSGGGHSGGGYSGGGYSHSAFSSSHFGFSIVGLVIIILFMVIYRFKEFILETTESVLVSVSFLYHARRAKRKTKKRMKEFSTYANNWEYTDIQPRIEEAYFEIQECWRRQDANYAAGYLSQSLLLKFQEDLSEMKKKQESVVQDHVRLLSASPVYSKRQDDTSPDTICYLIHGRMLGFYINSRTREYLRGNPSTDNFYEYWTFIYENNQWVLDKIQQHWEENIRLLSMSK